MMCVHPRKSQSRIVSELRRSGAEAETLSSLMVSSVVGVVGRAGRLEMVFGDDPGRDEKDGLDGKQALFVVDEK